MPNRLAHESSPYLLQHAGNPVDWYPWGEEAFRRARTDDRPIFLSIGYSTCHWCHVMEHESFEEEEVARVLNEHFVSIKVDREERPDVDRVYMTFVQATSGSGGWPMSVWLTPDLKPFYGGTYFPPTSRWGKPGFVDVLLELARLWREERRRVLVSADGLLERLRDATSTEGAPEEGPIILVGGDAPRRPRTVPPAEALVEGAAMFRRAFDPHHAGFGDAPKFPRPSELFFLLREYARLGAEDLRDMTLETLRAMALGGMRDHVGGGFHRYSVDAAWRVPHFEKMLYDQAQLALAYLEAAQASDDAFYASVAEDTLAYVRREMTHAEGGFYSAEDADSVPPEEAGAPHKKEGAFYVWSDEEIGALLGEDAPIVRLRYGIQPGGNAPHDPQGEFTGKNLLYTAMSIDDISQRTGRTAADVVAALGRARQTLFQARAVRPRPHLDDKILTAWNGLMIAAFARAARVLSAHEWLGSAERAARFVRRTLWREDTGTLLRRYRGANAAIEGYSEDYAYLVWGLLELFQATGAAEWLEWAQTLRRRQDELFWDQGDGGWFNTTGRDPSVLLRLKEEYDGAEPAASSVAAHNALLLAHLAGDADALEKAERTLARFGPRIGSAARAVPFMMANLSAWQAADERSGRAAGYMQIAVVGPRDRADTRALRDALARRFLPFASIVPVEPGDAQARLSASLPWIGAMSLVEGRAAAYVCRNFACDRPVTDVAALDTLVTGRAA
jgi:uncharacterized protein YyaL (SSP411 family)